MMYVSKWSDVDIRYCSTADERQNVLTSWVETISIQLLLYTTAKF